MAVPPTIGVPTARSGEVKTCWGRANDHGMMKTITEAWICCLMLLWGVRNGFMQRARRQHRPIAIWERLASLRHRPRPGTTLGITMPRLKRTDLTGLELLTIEHYLSQSVFIVGNGCCLRCALRGQHAKGPGWFVQLGSRPFPSQIGRAYRLL